MCGTDVQPTSNIVYAIACELHDHIMEPAFCDFTVSTIVEAFPGKEDNNDAEVFSRMQQSMWQFFEKYLSLDNFPMHFLIAHALDPSYKLSLIERRNRELARKVGEEMQRLFRSIMHLKRILTPCQLLLAPRTQRRKIGM